jgi:hypothetical protein
VWFDEKFFGEFCFGFGTGFIVYHFSTVFNYLFAIFNSKTLSEYFCKSRIERRWNK